MFYFFFLFARHFARVRIIIFIIFTRQLSSSYKRDDPVVYTKRLSLEFLFFFRSKAPNADDALRATAPQTNHMVAFKTVNPRDE